MPIPYYPNSSFWSTHPVFIGSLFTVIAIIVAVWIGHKEARRKGLDLRMFYVSTLWMGAGALLGGRIAYFLLPGPGFLDVMHNGFHSIGVIFGGAVGLLFYALYKKNIIKKEYKHFDFYLAKLADIWVLGAAMGLFFYRIGCFLTHCIEIGTPTNLPWAMLDNGVARHPINIYYSLTGLFIFVILKWFFGYKKIKKTRFGQRFDVEIASWFLILYCCSRFILDFFRVSIKHLGLSMSQWVFIIIFSIIIGHILIDKEHYNILNK